MDSSITIEAFGLFSAKANGTCDLFAALTLLNLPSGNVDIDQKIRLRKDQGRTGPNGHHQSCFATTALRASLLEALGIEKILQFPRVHPAKYRIIGEGRGELLLQFASRQKCRF